VPSFIFLALTVGPVGQIALGQSWAGAAPSFEQIPKNIGIASATGVVLAFVVLGLNRRFASP
jgi:hypothetical protein